MGIEKKTTSLYLLAFSALVLIILIFYYNNTNVKSAGNSVIKSQATINKSNEVLLDILNIETGTRGYLITGDETFLEPYNTSVISIKSNLEKLEEIYKGNADQQAQMILLKRDVLQRVILAKRIIITYKQISLNETQKFKLLAEGKLLTDKIRVILNKINSNEQLVLNQRKIESEKGILNSDLIFLFLILFILTIFGLVIYIIRQQKFTNTELVAFNSSQKELSKYSLSLIEASLDPLVTINTEGKIMDMNQATSNITGMTREQLTGSDFFDYFTEPQKAREVYQEVFKNGSVADCPLTIRHKDGKLTDVLFNGSVYKDSSENVMGVVIVARDVTAQKLQSKYSLSLIEASRDPLFAISREGKITDLNNASAKITELSRKELIGSSFINYFTEPEMARLGYQEVFSKGFVADFPLTILDGKETPALFNGSVYKDDRGNVLGAVVVARVITEQRRYERELTEARNFAEHATVFAEEAKNKAEEATKIAEDAVKSKQQFLSNMSHEIRTPMNAIIGFTKVILKTDLTHKQKEYLTAIKLSGDALIVLINDILDLAKVDAGKMTFEHIPFKLSLSISAMLHLFEPKIQEKNLLLIKEYDSKIPEVMVGDPVRLHQIILNLVSNAVKFTSKGKIIVSASLLSEDSEKATIEFAVTDTGIGIPENKIGKIFENFQQASSGTSRLYGGTGLGLSIVKQLVEPQGGTVSVKSKVDEGSVFSFILSFQKTNAKAEDVAEFLELDAENKNIKVLVVEDIPLNQLLMKTLLDDFGFEHDIASNGRIAIEKLSAKTFDIILMDLQMPEMNGFDATDYIRNTINSKIPIIALTADVTTVDLAKCKAVGMNDYIAKPVDERLLYNKIVGLVKKPKMSVLIDSAHTNLVEEIHAIKKPKCIDLDYLNQRTKSNPILIMEMITMYLQQTPPLLKSMKQCLLNKDWPALHAAVHKMIPSFLIMGINPDYENMARKVQDYAKTQEQTEGISDLVMQLESVCLQACKELEEEFNMLNTKH